MEKNNIRLILFINLLIVFSFLFASFSMAAVLHWNPVESTDRCVIAGYKVHYGTTHEQLTHVVDVGDVTSCNLDLLGLVPSQTYFFAISAYSTANLKGPLSVTISYTDRPNIVAFPTIDHARGTIDITFNEKDMQGADIKGNYEFSPTSFFDSAHEIVRTNRTYRLFMDYIPEGTIITMTVRNVTDNKGLALVSDSIVLNDDDKDGMADDYVYGEHSTVPGVENESSLTAKFSDLWANDPKWIDLTVAVLNIL